MTKVSMGKNSATGRKYASICGSVVLLLLVLAARMLAKTPAKPWCGAGSRRNEKSCFPVYFADDTFWSFVVTSDCDGGGGGAAPVACGAAGAA